MAKKQKGQDSDVQDQDQDQDFEKRVSRHLETKTQVSRTTTVTVLCDRLVCILNMYDCVCVLLRVCRMDVVRNSLLLALELSRSIESVVNVC